MKAEELSLKHKSLLNKKLQILGNGLSEYCFSNLYLFRKVHEYQVIKGEKTFISGHTYDGASFLMPVFDTTTVDSHFMLDSLAGFDFFFPIDENQLASFDPDIFSATYNVDDSDYIFSSEKLRSYNSRKLRKKRNLMNQFQRKYTVEFHTIESMIRKDAEEILKQWQVATGKTINETDFIPCWEALSLMDHLDLFGYICYADGKPVGFILAKIILPGICVFHFAKGNRAFKGVFQYMFNQFANLHAVDFEYYNFEQDMGKLNFRKTKESYSPDKLLHKYRVSLREKG